MSVTKFGRQQTVVERVPAGERDWHRDADFRVRHDELGLVMYFADANDEPHPCRDAGRAFKLVEATIGGASLVTKGTCNHVSLIDRMVALGKMDERKQKVIDRIEAAREELRKAQADLEAMDR